jgi:hypothetical protein
MILALLRQPGGFEGFGYQLSPAMAEARAQSGQ